MPSGLYGINNSNRSDIEHWGKNCFNSSFPTALATYMMDKDLSGIYARLEKRNGTLEVICDDISIRELFKSGERRSSDLFFSFESRFEPYQKYAFDPIDAIDLVVKDNSGNFLAPIEIKLTVLPTSATANKDEKDWGCELVFRTPTTSYCALGIWDAVKTNNKQIRDIFEDTCSKIQSWTNDFEMSYKTPSLCCALENFENEYLSFQHPLVLQLFWKTQGQSPLLCDQAFDMVIWSNLAFSRLFIDPSKNVSKTMSRQMRATARMARCLWELSKSGKIRMSDIYRQIAFDKQTDKELAIPGDRWRTYITSDRTMNPILSKDVLNEVILPGYVENLQPERRFDQTLYYSTVLKKQDSS